MNNGLFERLVIALEAIAGNATAAQPDPAPEKPAGRQRSNTKADAPKPEPVKADPPKDEPKAPAFDYDILKRAVIELASFSDDGRKAVVEIFTKHKVPDNKASNAPEALWPTLHTEITAALTKLQTAEGGEDDTGDFA